MMYRGVSTPDERSRARLGDVLWSILLMFAVATILVASRPATATNGAALTLATADAQFVITHSDVIALRTAPAEGGRATLHILLTAKAASELANFTSAELGKTATLVAPGEMIATTTLDEPIYGGYMGVTLNNHVRAARLVRMISGQAQ